MVKKDDKTRYTDEIVGGIAQDSNTFSPRKTTLETFRNGFLAIGVQIIPEVKGSNSFIGGVVDAAIQLGVHEGVRYGTIWPWFTHLDRRLVYVCDGAPCKNEYKIIQYQANVIDVKQVILSTQRYGPGRIDSVGSNPTGPTHG